MLGEVFVEVQALACDGFHVPPSRLGSEFKLQRGCKLRTRMESSMHLAQPISRHVRINLRRADTGVAEQFLNHAQVRSVIQQVRGKTVPQHMRGDIARNACQTRALFDAKPERDA